MAHTRTANQLFPCHVTLPRLTSSSLMHHHPGYHQHHHHHQYVDSPKRLTQVRLLGHRDLLTLQDPGEYLHLTLVPDLFFAGLGQLLNVG